MFQMVSDYIGKAKIIVKHEGFFVLLLKIFKRFKSIAFRASTTLWAVKDLSEEGQRLNGFSDYEVKFGDLKTITEWLKINSSDFPWMYYEKEISAAKEYGHIIPFLKHNNRIVGYTKVGLNKVYIRDYDSSFSLASNKAFFYDTTFLPEYRGKKLPRYLKSRIFDFLKERNIEYIYAHMELWNIPSIKSNKAMGFKNVCLNRFVQIFCFKFHSNNPRKLLS